MSIKKYLFSVQAQLACNDITVRKVTSKLSSKTVPVLPSLDPSLIFPFHLSTSPVHPIGFSFHFFPVFLVIFILLSSNNNNGKVAELAKPFRNALADNSFAIFTRKQKKTCN